MLISFPVLMFQSLECFSDCELGTKSWNRVCDILFYKKILKVVEVNFGS